MGLFNFFRKRKKQEEIPEIVPTVEEAAPAISKNEEEGLTVLLEQLPTTYGLENSNLVEITDSHVLARIDSLIPSAVTTATSVGNIIKGVKSKSETFYRVVLKKGGTLVDSQNTAGAKRGFTRVNGLIHENAEWIPTNYPTDNRAIIANAGATVMSVSSMVVGQYYIQQVNAQLGLISDYISKVIDILDIQYKSQVSSLIESVYGISKFQMSTIENEELRGRELNTIQQLRSDCQELLNRAETTLDTLIAKNSHNYDEYEKTVKEIDKWSQYQKILIKLLYQIDILDFTLHLGVKSKEQCFGTFTLHTDRIESIHTRLVAWHNVQCDILKIDLEECRRKNTGFLAWLEKPISLINDNWNYQSVEDQTIRMIKGQTDEIPSATHFNENLFNEDVQIIAYDGKYYYYPSKSNQ